VLTPKDQVRGPIHTTRVTVKGKLASGAEITMELPVPHVAGVNEGDLLGGALTLLRQHGGMMLDEDGGVRFIPLVLFPDGVHMKVNKIALADATSLPARVPGAPRLV